MCTLFEIKADITDKGFVRTYGFLASVLPYSNADWENLSIFLNFLIPKLPAPREEDLSRGILEAIDMDSYRVEAESALQISLQDEDGEIEPVPPDTIFGVTYRETVPVEATSASRG